MKTLFLSLLATVLTAPVAGAQTLYNFNSYTGNGLYVYDATVSPRPGRLGTKLDISYQLPSCPVGQVLSGTIRFDYEANDTGYLRDWPIATYNRSYSNDRVISKTIYTPYVMSTLGELYVENNLYCSH